MELFELAIDSGILQLVSAWEFRSRTLQGWGGEDFLQGTSARPDRGQLIEAGVIRELFDRCRRSCSVRIFARPGFARRRGLLLGLLPSRHFSE